MNENTKNIAKIINSKCRFQNCNDCIKSEDTCWEFEIATDLDKAGYRKQSERQEVRLPRRRLNTIWRLEMIPKIAFALAVVILCLVGYRVVLKARMGVAKRRMNKSYKEI